ncbi:hypothetical protein M3223_03275 [Paenibacillus pasadenensis]|uniref:NfeD family protein n=1 Tax=Paenibacillus pasadenensis TaxID=217090 RepID=UPI00203EDDB4|nr:NfeD family protein [Paenibacillus pasadenensis]MCM3746369.1 hypothetical protein [Paenibacillus pasadenensis]
MKRLRQTVSSLAAAVMLLMIQAAPAFASGVSEPTEIALANPYVAALLLFVGFTGTMLALLLSGFALPGLAGIIGFGLFFLGGHQAGYSEGLDVFFFVIGIVLLVLELFVPSFGILGILGVAALVRAILFSFEDSDTALISMLSAFAAALIVVTLIARRFKERGIWNRFVLKEQLTSEEGFVSAESRAALLHQEGVTITPLRPAGIVDIGGERIDVVTSGEFIAQNAMVKVYKVDGTRVIVRQV